MLFCCYFVAWDYMTLIFLSIGQFHREAVDFCPGEFVDITNHFKNTTEVFRSINVVVRLYYKTASEGFWHAVMSKIDMSSIMLFYNLPCSIYIILSCSLIWIFHYKYVLILVPNPQNAVPDWLQTKVKLRWDSEFLYVGAELRDPMVMYG